MPLHKHVLVRALVRARNPSAGIRADVNGSPPVAQLAEQRGRREGQTKPTPSSENR